MITRPRCYNFRMVLDISRYDDGNRHDLCIICREEGVEQIEENGTTIFRCLAKKHKAPRRIVIDPKMVWRVVDGEYQHESTGVFVRNRAGGFLFYPRALFPEDQLTVPSGHLDKGETPEQGAIRELWEETKLTADRLRHIATEEILGDRCRRGADHHRWHAYLLVLGSPAEAADIELNDEAKGKRGEWLTLEEALEGNLTHPVRFIITRHRHRLEQD